MNSKIILAKGIHIDRDYKNVVSYSVSDMITLLNSNNHYVNSADDFSFIRSQTRVSTPFSFDECIQSNYIAFQNPSYSNKWFFAFIDDVYYKSDGCTEITFTVDAFTTFWEDWHVKPCLTVREHVADDTIGLHTIEEGLDIGDDFIEEREEYVSGFSDYFYVAVETTYKPDKNSHARANIATDPVEGTQYNGICVFNKNVFGSDILLFDTHTSDPYAFARNLQRFIQRVSLDEHIGDIRNMYIIPSSAILARDLEQYNCYMTSNDDYPFTFDLLLGSLAPTKLNHNFAKITSFPGVTVKNNKCYCYPYNYLEVTNNAGNRNIYKYERFSGTGATFEVALAIGVGCSGRLTPTNYKGQAYNHDEDIPLGKFPTCSWSSDAYTNFLTQEALNNLKNIVFTSARGVASASLSTMTSMDAEKTEKQMSGITGLISNGFNSLLSLAGIGADMIGQNVAREMAPENYAGSNTAMVSFSDSLITFVFKGKRVKTENLQIIDDYFTKFGYKVARLKAPELHSRQYWNYVEIAQSEDIGNGDVPTIYMEQINNAFRRGLTIWHNHENIGNYNLSNTIRE